MSVLDTLEICFTANLDGVDAQLEGLIGRLDGLSGAIRGAGDDMSGAGGALMSGLQSGMAAGLPALRSLATAIGAETAVRLGAAQPVARSQGMAMVIAFSGGVGLGAQGAADAARSVSLAADFGGGAANAKSAGYALSAGFAAGIRSGSGAVGAAVSAIVSAATSRIRSLLAIHSPSKVAEGFSAYFGEGFALGVDGSVSEVARAADALAGAAVGAISAPALPGEVSEQGTETAVQRALGGVNLTVPLYVDGMKLGEASIRGINAVTRSAGRVLLEI